MSDVYASLGVKTLINAHGTVTKYGGSTMPPQVIAAMQSASQAYVELEDLQLKAGARLASLAGVPAAHITTGAAAGIVLSVAACIAGTNPEWVRRIPNTEGMKNEIILLHSHICPYEQQVRQGGGRVVTVGSDHFTDIHDVEKAVNERTAAILYFAESRNTQGSLPLRDIITLAKLRGLPVLVDAAAELPPPKHLASYINLGADLVQFSGGKDIRGPQSSGFILGSASLIEGCRLNSSPHSSIGRPFKVDKETIIGLLTAVELYLEQDFTAEMQQWQRQADYVTNHLQVLDGVTARTDYGQEPGIQPACIPRTYVTWDTARYRLTKNQLIGQLKSGEPGVIVSDFPDEGIAINPHMLEAGEEELVAKRIQAVLAKHRL